MIEADESGEKSAWTPRSRTITSRGILVLGVGNFQTRHGTISHGSALENTRPHGHASRPTAFYSGCKNRRLISCLLRESLFFGHIRQMILHDDSTISTVIV
jgi:hypothetical protein